MNEARRLQYLQVENSEEAALLVTSFKKFRSQSIKVGSSYYKLVLSQAGLSGLVDIWFPSCFWSCRTNSDNFWTFYLEQPLA